MPVLVDEYKMAILATNYPKYYIKEETVRKIEKFIEESAANHPVENRPVIKFDEFKSGVIYVTCANNHSKKWLKGEIKKLSISAYYLFDKKMKIVNFYAIPMGAVPEVKYVAASMVHLLRNPVDILQNVQLEYTALDFETWACVEAAEVNYMIRQEIHIRMKASDWELIENYEGWLNIDSVMISFDLLLDYEEDEFINTE